MGSRRAMGEFLMAAPAFFLHNYFSHRITLELIHNLPDIILAHLFQPDIH